MCCAILFCQSFYKADICVVKEYFPQISQIITLNLRHLRNLREKITD